MNRNSLYYFKLTIIWALYLPVVFATYLIVWLNRIVRFPFPFPHNLAAFTKAEAWCIKKLKNNGTLPQDAVVNKFKIIPLDQNLIFRSNAGIVEINFSHNDEKKILKCFAKFAPIMGTIWNRTIFNLQLNHIKETYFNRIFINNEKGIPAPAVYYTAMSLLTGNFCLITEFMDDYAHYLDSAYENFPDEHLQLAIEGMATLHAYFWSKPQEKRRKIFVIEDSTIYLFDTIVASSWSLNARNVMVQSWRKMNQTQTVIHGDSRVGNMMFPVNGKGRFVFIDWQAVRQGKAVYDLAYFLILSLTFANRIRVENQCLDIYYELLLAKGVKSYTREQIEEDYRHACICVLVMLSLPLLSGEASADGDAAKVFKFGMGVWRERMEIKFNEFDYQWMASRYEMSEFQARQVVTEMLDVIQKRLNKIEGDYIHKIQ